MLLLDMDHELRAEAADGHGYHVGVAYFPFDAAEEAEEGVVGEDVVEVAVGEEEDAFLFLVDMVDLDQFH